MSDDAPDRGPGTDEAAEERLPDDDYLFPAYADYCFANVPGTVASVLGADAGRRLPSDTVPDGEYSNVVVVLVDGLGWDRYRARRESVPLLDTLGAAGRASRLTSVYPSETAAAITTMHTGATPAEHGLLGWNVLFRDAGVTGNPSRSSRATATTSARPRTAR
ncbi:alkaline phosphatase family protein [Halobaculum litoreum]|uniref:Alkaline phosphatase family protein n=1 Tax=Halobaculum litoreum TaxID=3031998 RepID=A0ABD5XTX9_9EURY